MRYDLLNGTIDIRHGTQTTVMLPHIIAYSWYDKVQFYFLTVKRYFQCPQLSDSVGDSIPDGALDIFFYDLIPPDVLSHL